MIIIKQVTSLHETGVRKLNEASLLINEKLSVFGVFDGASSLDKYLSADGKTGAYLASNKAAEVFAGPHTNLAEALQAADQAIDQLHKQSSIDTSDRVNRFSTTVAAVKISEDQAELLQVGDSVIIVIYKDGSAKAPLGYHDHDLEVMRKWRKLADEGQTNIRQLVAEDVIQLRRTGNTEYGTLNGDGAAKKFMQTLILDLKDVASILIITDGMFVPKTDPETGEDWNYYAKLYKEGGLEKIYQTVREIEKSDPELIKYPRYKLHDDASGVAIDFE
jgi:serine/threonine protein phosphatase PrpC